MQRHAPTITLTGLDERSSLAATAVLLQRHPALEIGLLLSLTPEGRPRYPQRAWLAAAALAMAGRCAIHVCGSRARAALAAGDLEDLISPAARIQVNGTLSVEEVEALAARYPNHTLITQFNDHNAAHLSVQARNHALLIDASGGRGVAPGVWVRPRTDKAVGFAGGLGPLTLAEQLPRIAQVAAGSWWVDMESSLRDGDDWLDANRCVQALRAFEAWQGSDRAAAQADAVQAGPGRVLAVGMDAILGA